MDLGTCEDNEDRDDMNYELPEYGEDEGLEHDEGNVLNYMPSFLFAPDLKNASSWAQIVKQFLFLKVGVETKRQGDKTKQERDLFCFTEYGRWCDIINLQYPNNCVHEYLQHTSSTRNKLLNGTGIFRKFSAGLKIFGNKFGPTWNKILNEGVSGKSKDELWLKFCKQIQRKFKDVQTAERTVHWLLAFKHVGAASRVIFGVDVDEQLADPVGFSRRGEIFTYLFCVCIIVETIINFICFFLRGTGSAKRKQYKMGRNYHRQLLSRCVWSHLFFVTYTLQTY